MSQPPKILVISLTRMGDIIQSIPFFRRLRLRHPNAEIHMLVENCFKDVAAMVPGIDHMHAVTLEDLLLPLGTDKRGDLARAASFYRDLIRDFREQNYAEVWNLTHNRPSMVLNYLLSGENGRGVTLDHQGLQRVNSPWLKYFFATNLVRPWCQFNLVDIYANCVDGLDPHAGRDLSFGINFQPPEKITSSVRIAIHAGASQKTKQWPVEHYREVASVLSRHPNAEILLIGGRGDTTLAEAFKGIPGVQNLIGKTSVPNLAGLLATCQLLLSNDSGPMHIAAAVGTRVIDITVGNALGSETAPYGDGHLVVEPDSACFPCSPNRTCPTPECASRIRPDLVASLAQWQLGWRSAPSSEVASGARVYRTYLSKADGMLDLERLFGQENCLRDRLHSAVRPAWAAALNATAFPVARSADVPQQISSTANQALAITIELQRLALALAAAAPQASSRLAHIESLGRTIEQHEGALRRLLSRHGLLRSMLMFTDIARASIRGESLAAQAAETAAIYTTLSGLLAHLATGRASDTTKSHTSHILIEDAHENLTEWA